MNKYPAQRVFSAIGASEDSFKAAMVAAVESVLGPVHEECVTTTPSKGARRAAQRCGAGLANRCGPGTRALLVPL